MQDLHNPSPTLVRRRAPYRGALVAPPLPLLLDAPPPAAATGAVAGQSPCGVVVAAEILGRHGGAAAAPAPTICDYLQAKKAA
jgi:hypothetical protein